MPEHPRDNAAHQKVQEKSDGRVEKATQSPKFCVVFPSESPEILPLPPEIYDGDRNQDRELNATSHAGFNGRFAHRVAIAFRAISFRRSGVRLFDLASPPFNPPCRPISTKYARISGGSFGFFIRAMLKYYLKFNRGSSTIIT